MFLVLCLIPMRGNNTTREPHSHHSIFHSSADRSPLRHASSDEYARFAAIYDPATALWLDPLRKYIVEQFKEMNIHSVLDVCCGTGRLTGMLAHAAMNATGIDLSPSMLLRAQKMYRQNIVVSLQDATHMAFASHQFDAVVTAMALHEKQTHTRNNILLEMQRVLIPDGILAIIDYGPGAGHGLDGLFVRGIERFAGKQHYKHFMNFMHSGGLDGLPLLSSLTFLHSRAFTRSIFEIRLYRKSSTS